MSGLFVAREAPLANRERRVTIEARMTTPICQASWFWKKGYYVPVEGGKRAGATPTAFAGVRSWIALQLVV